MKIAIAKATPVTNYNPLPDSIIDRLVKKYSYMPDINMRLNSLPEIKRGKNIGKMPESTPHQNAIQFASQNGFDLYVGYLIEPDRRSGGLMITTHSFCVDSKRMEVVEPTSNVHWGPAVRYVGYPVNPRDYESMKYLNDFNKSFV